MLTTSHQTERLKRGKAEGKPCDDVMKCPIDSVRVALLAMRNADISDVMEMDKMNIIFGNDGNWASDSYRRAIAHPQLIVPLFIALSITLLEGANSEKEMTTSELAERTDPW